MLTCSCSKLTSNSLVASALESANSSCFTFFESYQSVQSTISNKTSRHTQCTHIILSTLCCCRFWLCWVLKCSFSDFKRNNQETYEHQTVLVLTCCCSLSSLISCSCCAFSCCDSLANCSLCSWSFLCSSWSKFSCLLLHTQIRFMKSIVERANVGQFPPASEDLVLFFHAHVVPLSHCVDQPIACKYFCLTWQTNLEVPDKMFTTGESYVFHAPRSKFVTLSSWRFRWTPEFNFSIMSSTISFFCLSICFFLFSSFSSASAWHAHRPQCYNYSWLNQ